MSHRPKTPGPTAASRTVPATVQSASSTLRKIYLPNLEVREYASEHGRSTHTCSISNYLGERYSSCVPPSTIVSFVLHPVNETCNSLGCQVVNDPGRRIVLLCQREERRNTCSTHRTHPSINFAALSKEGNGLPTDRRVKVGNEGSHCDDK